MNLTKNLIWEEFEGWEYVLFAARGDPKKHPQNNH